MILKDGILKIWFSKIFQKIISNNPSLWPHFTPRNHCLKNTLHKISHKWNVVCTNSLLKVLKWYSYIYYNEKKSTPAVSLLPLGTMIWTNLNLHYLSMPITKFYFFKNTMGFNKNIIGKPLLLFNSVLTSPPLWFYPATEDQVLVKFQCFHTVFKKILIDFSIFISV